MLRYMFSLHLAKCLHRGLPVRIVHTLKYGVKTYCCPGHLLPTCWLPHESSLAALSSGLEFTFQTQGGLGTREEQEM